PTPRVRPSVRGRPRGGPRQQPLRGPRRRRTKRHPERRELERAVRVRRRAARGGGDRGGRHREPVRRRLPDEGEAARECTPVEAEAAPAVSVTLALPPGGWSCGLSTSRRTGCRSTTGT
ncbi:hypothetical protein THAOC_06893, partial [Thalassiosira oceanica]